MEKTMIDVALIKQELILRVQKVAAEKYSSNTQDGPLKRLINRLETTKDFAQELTDILNGILKEKQIELDEKQKEFLIEEIKPTIIELMQGHILGKQD